MKGKLKYLSTDLIVLIAAVADTIANPHQPENSIRH